MEGMDFIDHEDLIDFGYTWKGMVGISRSLANAFYERNYAVYVLYDDNTESLVDEEYKLDLENVLYGIEKEDLAKYIFHGWVNKRKRVAT